MIYSDFHGRSSEETAAPYIYNRHIYCCVSPLTVSSTSLLHARTCRIPTLRTLWEGGEASMWRVDTFSTTKGLPLTLSEWEVGGLAIKVAGKLSATWQHTVSHYLLWYFRGAYCSDLWLLHQEVSSFPLKEMMGTESLMHARIRLTDNMWLAVSWGCTAAIIMLVFLNVLQVFQALTSRSLLCLTLIHLTKR